MLNLEEDIKHVSDLFYEAQNLLYLGKLEPMFLIWSHTGEITEMGPFGETRSGWDEVKAVFINISRATKGGFVEPRNLIIRVDGELAYTVCTEVGEIIDLFDRRIPVNHRATGVFRKEDGLWKLVHYHADVDAALREALGSSIEENIT